MHSMGNGISTGPKMHKTPDAGRDVYVLSDRKTPEQFAGRKVKVTGTLFQKTRILKVDSINTAK
jgi:hypothetical protein